jgi:DNA-binding CsgD family transcriptional regulator
MLDYEILFRLYDRFLPQGFQDIDPEDSLVLEVEEKLRNSGQFIHIADMIQWKILWVSSGCTDFYGDGCKNIDPAVLLNAIHPDDLQRQNVARSRVFKVCLEMYENKSGETIMSSNFKTRKAEDGYVDMLYQVWMRYEELPIKTIYQIQVNTDITGLADLKHGYHFYNGRDRSYFRYPDEALLQMGNVFSKREFEILEAIAMGLESHEIAEKMFLSIHTVNTHRRNILFKSGKRNTHELVLDLQKRGIL